MFVEAGLRIFNHFYGLLISLIFFFNFLDFCLIFIIPSHLLFLGLNVLRSNVKFLYYFN